MTTDSFFRILAVCTGNIRRSPLAERVLQSALTGIAPRNLEASSAGTGPLVDCTIDARVAGFVQIFDGNAEGLSARQLDERMLNHPDLMLTVTRQHRSKVN